MSMSGVDIGMSKYCVGASMHMTRVEAMVWM